MVDSILDSTKVMLGLPVDEADFDSELILYINSALSTLNQLGVGPVEGFMIADKEPVWADFIGTNPKLNDVKTNLFLRIKLIFDTPDNPAVINAIEEQIKETSWRINVTREETDYVDPDPAPIVDTTV